MMLPVETVACIDKLEWQRYFLRIAESADWRYPVLFRAFLQRNFSDPFAASRISRRDGKDQYHANGSELRK
jgi:ATP/maltotriose-dependent transcriptional regulator MalT